MPGSEAADAAVTEGAAPMSSSAPADGADFIQAETFSGSKLGYVFQAGSLGTGYYKDGIDKSLPPPPTLAGQTKPHDKALDVILYTQSNHAHDTLQTSTARICQYRATSPVIFHMPDKRSS